MSFEQNPLRVGSEKPKQLLIIAHRGARAFAPENTLPAFEKAITLGCQMVEMDVHMSRDRELIVYHDDQLTRCTDANVKFPGRSSYYVSDFTYDELLSLDAGSWYERQLQLPPLERQFFLQTITEDEIASFISPKDHELYASGAIIIPRLKDVLELLLDTSLMANIEIKSIPRMYPGITKAVVHLVESMGLEHRVLISSFDHEQLTEVRRMTKIIATGVLTSDRLSRSCDYLQLLDADAYLPGCYGEYDTIGFGSVSRKLDISAIKSVIQSNRAFIVWTCNDNLQIIELSKANVTGLITDFPNRVKAMKQKFQ